MVRHLSSSFLWCFRRYFASKFSICDCKERQIGAQWKLKTKAENKLAAVFSLQFSVSLSELRKKIDWLLEALMPVDAQLREQSLVWLLGRLKYQKPDWRLKFAFVFFFSFFQLLSHCWLDWRHSIKQQKKESWRKKERRKQTNFNFKPIKPLTAFETGLLSLFLLWWAATCSAIRIPIADCRVITKKKDWVKAQLKLPGAKINCALFWRR